MAKAIIYEEIKKIAIFSLILFLIEMKALELSPSLKHQHEN